VIEKHARPFDRCWVELRTNCCSDDTASNLGGTSAIVLAASAASQTFVIPGRAITEIYRVAFFSIVNGVVFVVSSGGT